MGQLEMRQRSGVKSEEQSRVHRQRLRDNGFLEEIMKGWLAVNQPVGYSLAEKTW
jgi:hypothetical protein